MIHNESFIVIGFYAKETCSSFEEAVIFSKKNNLFLFKNSLIYKDFSSLIIGFKVEEKEITLTEDIYKNKYYKKLSTFSDINIHLFSVDTEL